MAQRRLVELVLKGKDESKGAFDSLEKSYMGVTGKQALFAAGTLAVAAGLAKAGKELYDFTAQMAATGDRAAKLSYRLGLTVEGLSELEYIAKSGGVPVNQMAMAMQRMTRRMSEAAKGTGEAKDAIKELGIDATTLTLLSPDKQFYAIAEALQAVESQSDRLRLAFKLFDSEGVAVLQTLKRNVRESREEFEKFGGAMSAAFAGKSEEFTQAQTNLANATDRLKEALAEPFLTPFTNAINLLAENIAALKALSPGMQGGVLAALPGAAGAAFQGVANAGGGAAGRGLGTGDPYLDYLAQPIPPSPTLPRAPRYGDPNALPIMGHLRNLPEAWQGEAMARFEGADFSGLSEDDFVFPEAELEQLITGMEQMGEVFSTLDSQAISFGSSFATSIGVGLGRALTSAQDFSDVFATILNSALSTGLGMVFNWGFGELAAYIRGDSEKGMVSADNKAAMGGAGLKSMGYANTYAGGGYV